MRSLCIVLGFVISGIASASLLEVSVDTDKNVYQLNEIVKVYVSLYNPTPEAVTMYLAYPAATYLMDNTFFWHYDKIFPMSFPPPVTLQAGQSKTWQLEHGIQENTYYFLSVGNHSVQGVVNNLYSDPITFQIIPEPATMLLFALGGLLIRRK